MSIKNDFNVNKITAYIKFATAPTLGIKVKFNPDDANFQVIGDQVNL